MRLSGLKIFLNLKSLKHLSWRSHVVLPQKTTPVTPKFHLSRRLGLIVLVDKEMEQGNGTRIVERRRPGERPSA